MDFQVPRPLLERVFSKVYGLELDDLFTSYEVALGTYRWGFRTLLEEATGIAWELYRGDISELQPTATSQTFVFQLLRADFEKQFGKAFLEPGYFFRFVSFLGNLLPNVGPLKRLPYKPLPSDVRQLYGDAFHRAVAAYQATIANSGHQFWPGRFVNIRLILSTIHQAVLVPAEAPQMSAKGSFVYVVKSDSTAEQRPVELGQRQGNLVVVEKGIQAGEEIVTAGQLGVTPGGKVRVDAPANAGASATAGNGSK